ncbi:zinc-ribbon domain-containing protein [Halovenus aranensis]|uniref:Zinc-ribbon domain-containing protein n=1 Tax=Halovenus aranensis TaxID=890420 RepID=A0A1G8SYQ9_9EURY|nr:hypothetical protein [Halovenus aranensis]SDJ34306.1 zinc-ribbon domain-containing protein [Halovenus aranensis]
MSDSTSETQSRKRPWLALALTLLVPGLGHAYLRLWLRSILWLALYVTASTFVLPDDATPGELSVDAFVAASEAVPLEAAAVVLGVSVVCLVDVYMMTSHVNNRLRRASGAVTVCPNCGNEIDEDLSFCHWCTTELEESEA